MLVKILRKLVKYVEKFAFPIFQQLKNGYNLETTPLISNKVSIQFSVPIIYKPFLLVKYIVVKNFKKMRKM